MFEGMCGKWMVGDLCHHCGAGLSRLQSAILFQGQETEAEPEVVWINTGTGRNHMFHL